MLTGTITSASMSTPIPGVKIQGETSDGNVLCEGISNALGQWQIKWMIELKNLNFIKGGYLSKRVSVETADGIKVRLLEKTLIAYQERLWAKQEEKVSVYVNSQNSYQARLLRHGIKTETVADFGPFPPCRQEVPNGNFVDKGLDWKESFSYVVPADVRPGLFSLRLIQIDTDERYAISFVVSSPLKTNDKPQGILVLVSTNTWQSYNVWGGRSRYRNYEVISSHGDFGIKQMIKKIARIMLPPEVRTWIKQKFGMNEPIQHEDAPDNFMFKRLSVKRPHPQCAILENDPMSPFTSHLAPGEWRVLAWLEREGIPYDIVSGWEFSACPDRISSYKAILLNTHCEYWAQEMYHAVKKFKEKGGWILNLSGNSMYREIECYPDGSTRCVSLRLSESIDDEAAILGVRFNMVGYRTCASFVVKSDRHWSLQGVGLKNGDTFAMKCLNHPENGIGEGGSGHETDKITPTAPPHTVLLAKGSNPKDGGADMVIIENKINGGGVFSASSITFGGSLLVDTASSTITRNVILRAIGMRVDEPDARL